MHRDISPQNILLSWDGGVKIVDFGIARARDVHEEQGVIKGKFAYMSPEQARGEPVDCRSDVFAAGIVLYELVCARPLFHGKGKEALEMVKSGAIPRPRDFAPELPESLERIILKALAFHRADRFQTARDLQHELGRFQLEWGQKAGALIDSGSLAQQLAQLVPPEQRVVAPRPPAEGDARARASAPTPRRGDRARRRCSAAPPIARSSHRAVEPSAVAREPRAGSARAARAAADAAAREAARSRERKYVYVLRASCAAWRRSSAGSARAGAARLVNEFYKVARDVAFKHDALLDVPRLPADGKDVPIASSRDAGRQRRRDDAARRRRPAGRERGRRRPRDPARARAGRRARRHRLRRRARAAARARGPARRRAGQARREARARRSSTFEIEDATAAFAHKLARQARGAEILVGGRVFRAARAEWNFEALPAIDLPDDAPGGTGGEQARTSSTRTPIRASSARACSGCAGRRSARSGCASARDRAAACTAATSSSRRCATRGATCWSPSASASS